MNFQRVDTWRRSRPQRQQEHVLGALGDAADQLRERLGKSLKTVHQLATPTGNRPLTPSLEALQAYSMGTHTICRRAIIRRPSRGFSALFSLDPNLAIAYAALGTTYHTLGEQELARRDTRRSSGYGRK